MRNSLLGAVFALAGICAAVSADTTYDPSGTSFLTWPGGTGVTNLWKGPGNTGAGLRSIVPGTCTNGYFLIDRNSQPVNVVQPGQVFFAQNGLANTYDILRFRAPQTGVYQIVSLKAGELALLKEAMNLLRRVVAGGSSRRQPKEKVPRC